MLGPPADKELYLPASEAAAAPWSEGGGATTCESPLTVEPSRARAESPETWTDGEGGTISGPRPEREFKRPDLAALP